MNSDPRQTPIIINEKKKQKQKQITSHESINYAGISVTTIGDRFLKRELKQRRF